MTQSDQSDMIPHGPAPANEPGHAALGARSIKAADQPDCGVEIMLKGFEIRVYDDGEPIAAVSLRASSAVQAVQALRQAITDARRGIVR